MSRECGNNDEPQSFALVDRTLTAAIGVSSYICIIHHLDINEDNNQMKTASLDTKAPHDDVLQTLVIYDEGRGGGTCVTGDALIKEMETTLSNRAVSALVLHDLQTKMEATVVHSLHSAVAVSLRSLTLSNCGLNDDTALALSSAMVHPDSLLVSLDLSNNHITNTGAVALASNLAGSKLVRFYLSNNRLTPDGVAHFANSLPLAPHLQNLGLGDLEHLLPVTIFQKFLSAMENNFTLQTLTLGSEIMDGSKRDNGEMEFKEMDVNLAYWWQAPVYIAATDRMRFLLRLNRVFLYELLQTNQCSIAALRHLMDDMPTKHEVEALYRVLKVKPDFLATLREKSPGKRKH